MTGSNDGEGITGALLVTVALGRESELLETLRIPIKIRLSGFLDKRTRPLVIL